MLIRILTAIVVAIFPLALRAGGAFPKLSPRPDINGTLRAGGNFAPRSGVLASAELQLVGLRLVVPARQGDVPVNTPFVVKPVLMLGDREATPLERSKFLPPSVRLEAVLSGPGLSPLTRSGSLETGIAMPGLPQAGDYQVTNLRLLDGGKTMLDAGNIAIRCLGELLVSSVSSTPMTLQEIRESGIQTGPGSYEGRRFTVALTMGSQAINLTIPIARPIHNGLLDPRETPGLVGRLEIGALSEGAAPDLHVSVVDMKPDSTYKLSRTELQPLVDHGFKSVVVIPGSIKFLKQFFKVNLIVLNVLPDGSPYVVRNLKAKAALPPGQDGGVGTSDDPLKLVSGGEITDEMVKAVLGHNALGTPEEPQLKAGQCGSAAWLLRGDREGKHLVQFHLEGEFSGGLLTGPIPIKGIARGTVLVQNPTFHLLMVHPDVVRKNEVYELEAQVTNTSQAIANGVELALDMARMAGVRLDAGETASRTIDTLQPGQTVLFKFRLRALRNGEVVSTYQYYENGLSGSLRLGVGLGERSVRLSPDTLVLPRTLDVLPGTFQEAMLRVLGQAHSIATRKGALPVGVLPISPLTVTQRFAQELNEAGLFLRMGVSRSRVMMDLWKCFTQCGDPGFDQLMRTTEAGHELRREFLKALRDWRQSGGIETDLKTQAAAMLSPMAVAWVQGHEEGLLAGTGCADGTTIASGAVLPVLSAAGSALGVDGKDHLIQVPLGHGAIRFWVANKGGAPKAGTMTILMPALGIAESPTYHRFAFTIPPASMGFVDFGMGGVPMFRVANGNPVSADESVVIAPEPFQILGVHRWDLGLDPGASPYGTQVLVLFNRPNKTISLPLGEEGYKAGCSLVQVDGNALWRKAMPINPETGEVPPAPPALAQALPRIVSIYLEKPIGPNVPRTLSLLGDWRSAGGEALAGERRWAIQCSSIPGGATVRGMIRTPDGKPLSGTFSYWYFTARSEGGLDLLNGESFESMEEDYYALISNSVPVGPDGKYEIDFAPEPAKTAMGPLLITANTKEGTAFAQATVLGPGQTIEMDLVLEGKGRVSGRVTDAKGKALVGVVVQATQEQTTPSLTGSTRGMMQINAITDAQGTYVIENLKTGVFSLRAKQGLLGACRSAEIARDGESVTVDLVLDSPFVTIKARLLNEDGSPRVGQPLYLGIPAGLLRQGDKIGFIYPYSQITDSNGYTTFSEVPAGDVSVSASLRDGNPYTWCGYLKGGTTENVVIQLRSARKVVDVTVVVTDVQGAPVKEAAVYWTQNGNNGSQPAGHTDAEGRVTLPAPADEPYSVHVTHPGWTLAGQASATIKPTSGQVNVLPVQMPARSWAHGRVTRPDGTPVVRAIVVVPPVYKWTRKNRLTETDANGNYALPGLSVSDANRISIIGPDLRTFINKTIQGKAEAGVQADFVLPFESHNVLFGHVWQPQEGDQKLGAMATVEIRGLLPNVSVPAGDEANESFGLGQETLVDTFRSLSDGSYRATRDLPSGPYTLTAWNDFFPVKATVTGNMVGPKEEMQRDITLISNLAGALEGRVYAPDGCTRAPKGTRVALQGGALGSEGLMVEVQDGGSFAFPRVIPAGDYTLTAEDPISGARCVERVNLENDVNRFRTIRLLGRGKLTVRLQDAQGKALVAGNVLLQHQLEGMLGKSHFPEMAGSATEANQGVLIFEDLWEGSVRLDLRKAALRGAGSVQMPQGGGDMDVTVRLQPTGGVTGLLKRADGTPVTAGRVDVYIEGKWFGVSNTTLDGEVGRFRFQGLPAGFATLEAFDPDSRQVGTSILLIPDQGEAVCDITCLDKGPVSLLVTREGKPVQRASVLMTYKGGHANIYQVEATTDASGKASFVLPPGDWEAAATDPITLATGSLRLSRAANQGTIALELRLSELRNLNVTVIPPPGHGGDLTGWRIRSENGRTAEVRPDRTVVLPDMMVGRFRVTLHDGMGRVRGSRQVELTYEGANDQFVQLKALARGHVEVRVKNADGTPTGLAEVSICSPDMNLAIGTTPEGTARFDYVLQGIHGLQAKDSATGMSVESNVTVEHECAIHVADLVLGPTAHIQGTLRESDGKAVPFAPVWVKSEKGGMARNLATDGEGRFAAEHLPLGSYSVWSTLDGRNRSGSRRVLLTNASEWVDASFTLSGAGTLTGRVVDPLRADSGVVYLRLKGNLGYEHQLVAESGGGFQFVDVPAGQPLTLSAVMDDGITTAGTLSVQVPADGSQHVDFTMEPRPRLFGRTLTWLKDATDGKPYEAHRSMTILLQEATSGRQVKRTSTSVGFPQYSMNYLVPGLLYRMTGYDGQVLVAQGTFTLAADKESQTYDLYTLPTRTVRARLLNEDGTQNPAQGRIDVISQQPGGGTWTGNLLAGAGDVADVVTGPVVVRLSGVPGQPVMESEVIQLLEGSSPCIVDFRIQGTGRLRVKVMTQSGRMLRGAKLAAQANGSPVWEGQKQADESWIVEGVWVNKPVTLALFGFGNVQPSPTVTLQKAGDVQDVVLVQPDQGSLSGIVLDATGNAMKGAALYLGESSVPAASTDAAGQFSIEGVLLGTHLVKANLPGHETYGTSRAVLGQDGGTSALTIRMLGQGTVEVLVLDAKDQPLAGQLVELKATGWTNPTYRINANASGLARFDGVVEGPFTAQSVLNGLTIDASGALSAGAVAQVRLVAKPTTRLTGRIRRATQGLEFPRGTVAFIRGEKVPMALDGTLLPLNGALVLGDPHLPAVVHIQIPQGPLVELGKVDLVVNGDTVLDLKAPPFGALEVMVQNKVGQVLEGAQIRGVGLSGGLTDGLGIWRGHRLLEQNPALNTFEVAAALDRLTGSGTASLKDEATPVRVKLMLIETAEVHGLFTGGGLRFEVFQDGPQLWIDAYQDGVRLGSAQGTLQGHEGNGAYHSQEGEGTFVCVFSEDLATLKATVTDIASGKKQVWEAARQAGVAVKVLPEDCLVATLAREPFRALVAGTKDGGVNWASSAGAISPVGLLSAPQSVGRIQIEAASKVDPGAVGRATADVRLPGVYVIPGTRVMDQAEAATFEAKAIGLGSTEVQWTSDFGVIDPQKGIYTAPDMAGECVLVATSVVDRTQKGIARVTVRPMTLHIEPAKVLVRQGETYPFQAIVTGTRKPEVSWETALPATVDGQGRWTAPASPGLYILKVRSQRDTSVVAEAQITVPEASLVVSPSIAVVKAGGSLAFSAKVQGTVLTEVRWKAEKGKIEADGTYTAPLEVGVDIVTATLVSDSSIQRAVSVAITPDGRLDVSGTWSDGWYSWTLFQNGDRVWGMRYGEHFLATLNGNTLTGVQRSSWGTISINFIWTLALDGNSFNALWASGTGQPTSTWSGAKQPGLTMGIDPASALLAPGASQAFTALVAGHSDKRATWTIREGSAGGTVTPGGAYTAPVTPGTYHLVATSVADVTRSAEAAVVVRTEPYALVTGVFESSRGRVVLQQSGAQVTGRADSGATQFEGSLEGLRLKGTWYDPGRNTSGRFQVDFQAEGKSFMGTWGDGDSLDSCGWWFGTRREGEAQVLIEPANLTIRTGTKVTFKALVGGAPDNLVSWKATSGDITPDGQYTAPLDPATVTVTATSSSLPGVSGVSIVKVVPPVTVAPVKLTLLPKSSQQFLATLTGFKDNAVTWTAPEATITPTGLMTVPDKPGPATITVRATSMEDNTCFGEAIVTVPQVEVILEHAAMSLPVGRTHAFKAKVTGHPVTAVNWTVTDGASLDANGLFTAPKTPGTYEVKATSVADPTRSASCIVTVISSDPNAALLLSMGFEEGQGLVARDGSGNGLNGLIQGDVSWVEGRLGGLALDFPDFSSQVEVPHDSSLNSGSLTVAFWMRLNSAPNVDGNDNWRSLIRKGALSNGSNGFSVDLRDGREIAFTTGTDVVDAWTPKGIQPLALGQWVHVALTYDENTGLKQAYLDGVPVDSKTLAPKSLTPSTSSLYINHSEPSVRPRNGGHFDGTMDDVRIYSRALQADEILGIMGGVAIQPRRPRVKPGQTIPFKLLGAAAADWKASRGTVTEGGEYTAPLESGTYTLTASLKDAPSSKDQIQIEVVDHDAALDFKLTNPNSPWTYGYLKREDMVKGEPVQALNTPRTHPDGRLEWSLNSDLPCIYLNPSVTFIEPGTGIIMPSGSLNAHPGWSGEAPVVRWVVPEDGNYEVYAGFEGRHTTTTDVHLRVNGQSVLDGMVNLFLAGPSYRQLHVLKAGQVVDAIVGYGSNGSYYCDTTGVDLRIRKVKAVLQVAPALARLAPGGSFVFSVSGVSGTSIVWSVKEGSRGGQISSEGHYTAPMTPGVYSVVARSIEDLSLQAQAEVVVAAEGTLEPIAHFNMDEGTGNAVRNLGSLQSVQGNLVEGAWVPGRKGMALDLGTASARVDLSSPVPLGKVWTIAAWVKTPLRGTSNWHTLTHSQSHDKLIVVLDDQEALGSYDYATGSGFHDSGFRMDTLAPGWHHIAAVGSAGTTRFFVDGLPAGVPIATQSTSNISVLGNYQYGGQPMGSMDDLRIYQRALAPMELKALASPPQVVISPEKVTLLAGATQAFQVQVTGAEDARVEWTATGGSIDDKGTFTAGHSAGTFKVVATSVADKNSWAEATVTVVPRAGDLNLLVQTADGRPVPNYSVRVIPEGGTAMDLTTGADGKVVVLALPKDKAILIQDGNPEGDPWMPRFPNQTLPVFWSDAMAKAVIPVGRVKFRVEKSVLDSWGSEAVRGVPAVVMKASLSGKAYPKSLPATTDQNGWWDLDWAPLGQSLDIDGSMLVSASWKITASSGSETRILSWPKGQDVAVKVMRANGQEMKTGSVEIHVSPGDEFGPMDMYYRSGDAHRIRIPSGVKQQIQARYRVADGENGPVYIQDSVSHDGSSTPDSLSLHMPAMTELKVQLTGPGGKALDPSLVTSHGVDVRFLESPGGYLNGVILKRWLYGGNNGPLTLIKPGSGAHRSLAPHSEGRFDSTVVGSLPFDRAFLGGDYRIQLRSEEWGDLGTMAVAVKAEDDGSIKTIPLDVDLVRSHISVAMVMGDGETPVWGSVESFYDKQDLNGYRTYTKGNGIILSDQHRATFDQVGVRGRSINLLAIPSGWGEGPREDLAVTKSIQLQESVDVKITVPMTVLRTRLQDASGATFEGGQGWSTADREGQFAVMLEGGTWLGDKPPLIPVRIGNAVWSVAFGLEPGPRDIEVVDHLSGLGYRFTADIPAVGGRAEKVFTLPNYLVLKSAALAPIGPAPATEYLVGVSAEAPGLIHASLASWWMKSDGWHRTDLLFPSDKDTLFELTPDRAAQPLRYRFNDGVGSSIRVPAGAELWLAEGKVDSTTGEFVVEGRLGKIKLPSDRPSGTVIDLVEASELVAWKWVDTPVKVEAPSDFGVLTIRPQGAPAGWHIPVRKMEAWTDFLPQLPVGVPVVLETFPLDCGVWYWGRSVVVPVDLAPRTPFLLQANERREIRCLQPPS